MDNKKYLLNLLKFWRYKYGPGRIGLGKILSECFDVSGRNVFLLENGRTAEYLFLKSLNLKKGSKVAIQCFTCNAVVNPILWNNLKPLYIDIDEKTLNMSLDSLYARIDENTKVVVLQHTFANPLFSSAEAFSNFVEDMHSKGIVVFEDCAHALGSTLEGKALGTFGDACLVSFGIEKVLSTRVGGALIVNSNRFLKDVKDNYANFKTMGYFSTFLWLLNPAVWRILRKFRNGLKVARFLNSVKLLNMGFQESELLGEMPGSYPKKLSNALSEVVLGELSYMGENMSQRKDVSDVYEQYLSSSKNVQCVKHSRGPKIPFLKYPIVCETEKARNRLREFLELKGTKVADWYDPIIYPKGTDFEKMCYEKGTCPCAENVSPRVLNLPTGKGISLEYAKEICENIILFFEKNESN